MDAIFFEVFIIYPGGENCKQLLHRRFLPLDPISGHSRLLSISPPCHLRQSSLHRQFLPRDLISGHSRLLSSVHFASFVKILWRPKRLRRFVGCRWILKMWELVIFCMKISCFCTYFLPLKTALFPHFSHWVLRVLPRLVWSQKSCNVSLFSQL